MKLLEISPPKHTYCTKTSNKSWLKLFLDNLALADDRLTILGAATDPYKFLWRPWAPAILFVLGTNIKKHVALQDH